MGKIRLEDACGVNAGLHRGENIVEIEERYRKEEEKE